MGLEVTLVILVIFGIVGFITEKIFGINPYKIFSDIGAAILIISLAFFIFPVSSDPNVAAKNIGNMITFFVESLPGILIGDVAGTIIAAITGDE